MAANAPGRNVGRRYCKHRELETLANGAERAVYQCGHGLLHLRVHRVTLTLTPDEFRQLAVSVTEAYIRLGTREAVRDAWLAT